ncbi:hypothetical protein E3N88_20050 [Mikania micrantha]|uniref:Uncharacterized protein n=1 Tax=Mikania micrantha TaxID=192012 RepID=A0A5N6NIB5_9ASTR|nr:hypothetical protein E3N88_20050 [Mikania micrantha]
MMSFWDGSFFNYSVPDLNEEPPVEYSYGTIHLNAEPNVDVGFDSQASYGFVYDDSKQSNPEEGYEEKPVASNINWETKEEFMSEKALVEWVKSRALDNGYIVVKRRTKKSKTIDSVIKVWLMCDRSGEHNSIAILRRSGRKKIGFPFQLKGLYNEVRESWKLQVINDNHNHEPAQNLEGHPYVRRFTQEEEDLVENLTKRHMDPCNILSSIKKHNPANVSVPRDAYNLQQKIKKTRRNSVILRCRSWKMCFTVSGTFTIPGRILKQTSWKTFSSVIQNRIAGGVISAPTRDHNRWHIDENIAKHCKASFSDADWKKFKGRWPNLCNSPTTELYDYNYNRLYERLIKDNKKNKKIPLSDIDIFWTKLNTANPTLDKKTPSVQKDTRGRPTLKAQKQKEQDVVKDNLASQESTFESSRHSSFTAVTEKSQKPVFRRSRSTSVSKAMPPSDSLSQNEFRFPRNMKPEGLNNVYHFGRHIIPLLQPYVINIQDVDPDGNCGFRSVVMGLGFDESH